MSGLHILENFFKHYIWSTANTVFIYLQNFQTVSWGNPWNCYIKLIMQEHWLWKVYVNLFKPWLLLMIIAKQTNRLRWNLKGIFVSVHDKDSLGINTLSPLLLLVITFPSRRYLSIFMIIILVPLHRPLGSKFLIKFILKLSRQYTKNI